MNLEVHNELKVHTYFGQVNIQSPGMNLKDILPTRTRTRSFEPGTKLILQMYSQERLERRESVKLPPIVKMCTNE